MQGLWQHATRLYAYKKYTTQQNAQGSPLMYHVLATKNMHTDRGYDDINEDKLVRTLN